MSNSIHGIFEYLEWAAVWSISKPKIWVYTQKIKRTRLAELELFKKQDLSRKFSYQPSANDLVTIKDLYWAVVNAFDALQMLHKCPESRLNERFGGFKERLVSGNSLRGFRCVVNEVRGELEGEQELRNSARVITFQLDLVEKEEYTRILVEILAHLEMILLNEVESFGRQDHEILAELWVTLGRHLKKSFCAVYWRQFYANMNLHIFDGTTNQRMSQIEESINRLEILAKAQLNEYGTLEAWRSP